MATEVDVHNQSSMTYWWPRLQTVDVLTPETVRVEASPEPFGDGNMEMPMPTTDDLAEAVASFGGPPAFVRTDLMSAKHNMAGGSFIDSVEADDLRRNVGGLVEQHAMAWGAPDPECYYVREWLDLWHRYKTFKNGATPVAAEIRTFIHEGELHDMGFYWPMEATWGHSATEEDWRELHQETEARADEGAGRVADLARQVAEEFDAGYWSCDFALTESGEWYAIDMARGELSWHPDSVEKLAEPEGVDPT